MIKENEEKMTNEFLSVCGTWEDNQSVEYQIKAIYSSRSSTNRMEEMK